MLTSSSTPRVVRLFGSGRADGWRARRGLFPLASGLGAVGDGSRSVSSSDTCRSSAANVVQGFTHTVCFQSCLILTAARGVPCKHGIPDLDPCAMFSRRLCVQGRESHEELHVVATVVIIQTRESTGAWGTISPALWPPPRPELRLQPSQAFPTPLETTGASCPVPHLGRGPAVPTRLSLVFSLVTPPRPVNTCSKPKVSSIKSKNKGEEGKGQRLRAPRSFRPEAFSDPSLRSRG